MLTRKHIQILIAAVLLGDMTVPARADHDAWFAYYAGHLSAPGVNYDVHIDDTRTAFEFITIAKLTIPPIDGPDFHGIVGNGNRATENGPVSWTRIYFCGPRRAGDKAQLCNSAGRTDHGWEFELCPQEKGTVEPFSGVEITGMIALLDRAILEVRKPKNLKLKQGWDPVTGQADQIFPPPPKE